MITLHHADALDVLRSLPDSSVDAVCTDPPYGLSELRTDHVTAAIAAWVTGDRERVPDGRGFMGRTWDAFVPPPAVWDECLRVLRPGGWLAAFAGARTVDLMGLSVRLAGFTVHDGLQWLYGCLDDRTEILTATGWRNGLDVEVGDQVAQWDPASGDIALTPALDTFRGPWDGPMRVLRSADTDQLLTPNHRVYHRPRKRRQTDGVRTSWYGTTWEVTEAGDLSRWNPVQLPIAGQHDGPGIGGTDYAELLGWVWTEGGFDPSGNGVGVRVYQSSVNAEKVARIQALLDRLGDHKRYDRDRVYDPDARVSYGAGRVPRPGSTGRGRTYTETCWFITGDLARRVRADLPGKRPTYDLLWRMTGAEKRAMRDAALLGDGHVSPNGTWQFYQRHEEDLVWFSTLLTLVGQAGKVGMRPDRDNGTVYVRRADTTEMQVRHLRDDAEHYTGEVWCVRVPTGAFVARRNGKVFITGNSGMPKGLDVGKAIDKAGGDALAFRRFATAYAAAIEASTYTHADVDRALGIKSSSCYWARSDHRGGMPPRHHWEQVRELLDLDAELAAIYDAAEREVIEQRTATAGGGTSLNLRTGERREVDASITAPATDAARTWDGWNTQLKPAHEPIVLARKPLAGTVAANVLAHGTGALNVDACRVGSGGQLKWATPRGMGSADSFADDAWTQAQGRPYAAATENTVGRHPANVLLDEHAAAWLDEQSGIRTSGKMRPTHTTAGRSVYGQDAGGGFTTMETYGDTGGASRFFPTFHYSAKAPKGERPLAWGPHVSCRCTGPTARPIDPETGALPPWWRQGSECASCGRPAVLRGHPTVKPQSVAAWLLRLLVRPGGSFVDPFAGSGAFGQAGAALGLDGVLVERDEHSIMLCEQRLDVRRTPLPVVPGPTVDVTPITAVVDEVLDEVAACAPPTLLDLIGQAADEPACRGLFHEHATEWTPEHTVAVIARLSELGVRGRAA